MASRIKYFEKERIERAPDKATKSESPSPCDYREALLRHLDLFYNLITANDLVAAADRSIINFLKENRHAQISCEIDPSQ